MPSLATLPWIAVAGSVVAAVGWLLVLRRRLAAENRRFLGFMNHGPFLAFMKDADGRYAYENRAMAAFIGRVHPGTTTIVGRTDGELFEHAEVKAYVDHDRQVAESGRPLHFDEVSVDADGTMRHWSTIKFPWTDGRGRRGVAGISIDVTAEHDARRQAQSHADDCALTLEAGRMGTFTLDLATRVLHSSPLFAVLNGRPATRTRLGLEEALAEVHPDDRPKILAAVQAALQDKAPSRIQYRVVAPPGPIRWIELMGRVYGDETGRPQVVRGVGFDVTEQRSAFEEITRRKHILRRLIEVQENERQTLCHELHDGLMQYIIGAKMLLDVARDEADDVRRVEQIDAAIDCIARGIAEGRQVIRGVRPAVLDDLGLAAAVEDLVEQMAAAGIVVEAAVDEGLESLPPALQTTVYRVVQESLSNVRKYSGSHRATVAVRLAGDEVCVTVGDDGAGFDFDEARRRGFGLVGMTERVRLAGGTIDIDSLPGRGCRVSARLPTTADDELETVAGPAGRTATLATCAASDQP